MNPFGAFDIKTNSPGSFLPGPKIGTPNSQTSNSIIRKLDFEDDSNSNSPVSEVPTKSLAGLFLKKERKHCSDPIQLKTKTFPNPFGTDMGLSSFKLQKKELTNILQEKDSKTDIGESLSGSPSADTDQGSQNSVETESNTSLLETGIEVKFDLFQRKKSYSQGSFYQIAEKMKALQETQPSFCSEILDLSQEFSKNLTLSTSKNNRDPDLNTISPQTVASLLYDTQNQNYLIVDCRYGFEYQGGHIKGALHIESPQVLEQVFFTYKHLLCNSQYIQDLKKDFVLTLSKIDSCTNLQTAEQENNQPSTEQLLPLVIFHCEFSQKRGPRVFRALRARDRELNEKNWPKLDFPEIYVLDGGYCNFYSQFPEYCEGDYVKMVDKRFKKEYAEAKALGKKLWKKSLTAVDLIE